MKGLERKDEVFAERTERYNGVRERVAELCTREEKIMEEIMVRRTRHHASLRAAVARVTTCRCALPPRALMSLVWLRRASTSASKPRARAARRCVRASRRCRSCRTPWTSSWRRTATCARARASTRTCSSARGSCTKPSATLCSRATWRRATWKRCALRPRMQGEAHEADARARQTIKHMDASRAHAASDEAYARQLAGGAGARSQRRGPPCSAARRDALCAAAPGAGHASSASASSYPGFQGYPASSASPAGPSAGGPGYGAPAASSVPYAYSVPPSGYQVRIALAKPASGRPNAPPRSRSLPSRARLAILAAPPLLTALPLAILVPRGTAAQRMV